MIYNYDYLLDEDFLKEVDLLHIRERYARITVLDWQERPIDQIQGKVQSGTINLNATSAIRRNGNLSMLIDETDWGILDVNNKISINKKISLEIGLKNLTNKYLEYPIIWFPMGIYVVAEVDVNHSSSGLKLSLQIKDKMCLLNGDCGGNLPAAITFTKYDTSDAKGNIYTDNPTIYRIVLQLVNHWGGEDIGKIIINGLPEKIKNPIYWENSNRKINEDILVRLDLPKLTDKRLQEYDTEKLNKVGSYLCFKYGSEGAKLGVKEDLVVIADPDTSKEDEALPVYLDEEERPLRSGVIPWFQNFGYQFIPFCYPEDLVSAPGDTITSILDKIKSILKNYEYFYDIYGNFHFQEIENYLDTTEATVALSKMTADDYLLHRPHRKVVYSFDDAELITSFSNKPQYTKVKNDFTVWGKKHTSSEDTVDIRYHLVIDTKPTEEEMMLFNQDTFFYLDEISGRYRAAPLQHYADYSSLPKQGYGQIYYYVQSEDEVYIWSGNDNDYISLKTEDVDESTPGMRVEVFYANLPEKGKNGDYYYIEKQDAIYRYLNDKYQKICSKQYGSLQIVEYTAMLAPSEGVQGVYYYGKKDRQLREITGDHYSIVAAAPAYFIQKTPQVNDWRQALYLRDTRADKNGIATSYYHAELKEQWPKIYDVVNDEWEYDINSAQRQEMNYFLDFIDTNAEISKFSVSSIGRRQQVLQDDKINCLFEEDIPDLMIIDIGYLEQGETMAERAEKYITLMLLSESGVNISFNSAEKKIIEEVRGCYRRGQRFALIDTETNMDSFIAGDIQNSAFAAVRDLLYQYTSYNENITIQAVPIYHLEPNTRIRVADRESSISGDYMINSISVPLDIKGTMSIQATRALEKF